MSLLPRIGVLAVQGDVREHISALEESGARAGAVKTPADLESMDALIIPGGESTTVIKLLERVALAAPLQRRAAEGMPVWGTCMGMILCARNVVRGHQPTLDLIDIAVRRNAFGRQIASAEVALDIQVLGETPFPGIFIRAPWIESAAKDVCVLASLDGHGVLVRQHNVLASAFHPELTTDRRLHRYFVAMVNAHVPIGTAAARA
ncbi:MAG: pyridoxal 5'-phosphate synthase glutaminase subunit PdxT [Candidatus Eremiobacteraeota bacterium]|nr:pyridoxal 5'-phosphate synthase glutaminase subunit PdxT [Candidatus Eremiobacteraeota bacterium]